MKHDQTFASSYNDITALTDGIIDLLVSILINIFQGGVLLPESSHLANGILEGSVELLLGLNSKT